jgi:hypothetical protein
MNELSTVRDLIRDLLQANSNFTTVVGTKSYVFRAKQNEARPYHIFNFQSATDVQGLGDVRLLTRPIYQSKIVIDGFPTTAVNRALDAMDEVLGRMKVAVKASDTSNNYVISARRFSPIEYAENNPTNNGLISHLGGLYRFEVSPA